MFLGTVWWNILFEKILFFYRFWTFRDNITAFGRKLFKTTVRIAFWLSKATFWGNLFLERICFSLTYKEQKPFGNLSQSLLAWSGKQHFLCLEAQFGEKCNYCLDRNLVFFHFRTSRLFSRLQARQFWQCCQKCILLVHRIILRTNTFCRRINLFFQLFRNLGHFFAIISTYWLNRQNCIPRVEMRFEEVFLERFFVTFGHGAKRFGLLSKYFYKGFQTSF